MPVIELSVNHDMWLTKMADHLKGERYSREGKYYVEIARRFLLHLETQRLTLHGVQPSDLAKYLRGMKRLGRFARRTNLSEGQRQYCRAALHMLLRLVHGKWPPAAVPATEQERFHFNLIKEYDSWMMKLRGLRPKTCCKRCASALRFLEWFGERHKQKDLGLITVADIDAYIQWRVRSLRRASKRTVTVHLRSFLRYLHSAGRIPDLASRVLAPSVY